MTSLTKIIFVVIAYLFTTSSSSNDACQTPEKDQGLCKPLKECLPLYSLFDNLTQDAITHLRKSQCGFEGKKPKVCCPTSSSTIQFHAEPPPRRQEVGTTFPQHKLVPSKEVCGLSPDNKIIRGPFLYFDQYPWTAALIQQGKVSCGGTLINSRYVITAAQCVHGRTELRVRLGEHNFATNPDCEEFAGGKDCAEPFVEVPAERIIVHEDYKADDQNHQHDIALIRLNNSVTLNDFLRPICLSASINVTRNYTGVLVQPGWHIGSKNGSASIRSQTNVRGQRKEECEKRLGFTLAESQFCSTKFGRSESCSADMGGSVMTLDEESVNFYLVGLVSKTTCEGNQVTLYTKVGDYVEWIVSKLQE